MTLRPKNGVAERGMRTRAELARALLIFLSLAYPRFPLGRSHEAHGVAESEKSASGIGW